MQMKELTRRVWKETSLNLTKKEVAAVLDALSVVVGDAIESGESVKLNKVGTFKVICKKPRMIYKPIDNERCMIGERKRIVFSPYSALKDRLGECDKPNDD